MVAASINPSDANNFQGKMEGDRLTLIGVDSRVPTVTECAKLPNLMALLFIDGRLMPAKISQRGPLQDAQELYSYVSRRCEAKAVFVFDRCPSLGARDHQARLHERGSSADG